MAHLNCDSPGCRWATSYETIACTAEMEPLVREVVVEVTGQTARRKRPQRNSDFSFNNIGISGLFSASSMLPEDVREEKGYYVVGGCGGNIAWHTEDDTIEIADREVLRTDIRLYLAAVLRLANDAVLPIDWRASAAELAAVAEEYRAAAGDAFDLSPVMEELAALTDALEEWLPQAGSRRRPRVRGKPNLRALCRILVPLNYVRGPRFSHDPALNVPPLPALAAARPSRAGRTRHAAWPSPNFSAAATASSRACERLAPWSSGDDRADHVRLVYDRSGPAAEVLRVEHVPLPTPGPGEVRVALHASGVNPHDTKKRSGWTGAKIEGPVIPHSDGAGVIDAVGPDVDPARVGERVYVVNAPRGKGTAAEPRCCPAHARSLPPTLSLVEGAALGVPHYTAWLAVLADGPVAGQTLLIQGGGGAVGRIAVELARWPRAPGSSRQAGAGAAVT